MADEAPEEEAPEWRRSGGSAAPPDRLFLGVPRPPLLAAAPGASQAPAACSWPLPCRQ
jgi:hypothetical protein